MDSKSQKVASVQSAAPKRYEELRLAAAGVLSGIALIRIFGLFAQLPPRAHKVDYSVYYLSGYLLRHGENPYTADLNRLGPLFTMDTRGIERATDPPTFLAMFEPLTLLGPRRGYWTWQAINALALGISLWMLFGRGSELRPEFAVALAALAVMYPGVLNHFYFAQNKVQILLLLVLTMRLLESRRDTAAGLVLALAALMRVFPLLLVGYLLIQRRWRAVLFTGVGLVGGLIATGLAIGFPVAFSFVNGIDVLTATRWLHYDTNVALTSFVSRLYWSRFGEAPGTKIDTLRHATIAVAWLATLSITCLATLRTAPAKDRSLRAFGLWVATAIALSPTAWIHYMVLLFIPFAQIISSACRHRSNRGALTLAVASYALLTTVCPWGCTTKCIPYAATLSLALAWAAAFAFAIGAGESESAESLAVQPHPA